MTRTSHDKEQYAVIATTAQGSKLDVCMTNMPEFPFFSLFLTLQTKPCFFRLMAHYGSLTHSNTLDIRLFHYNSLETI